MPSASWCSSSRRPSVTRRAGPRRRDRALLRAAAYGTYDLTDQATLKGWRWPVTVVDIAWGASLTALVTMLAVAAARA